MAIQFLRGSADNINSSTTKLLDGQPLVDISNGRLYIGDSKTQIGDLFPINKATSTAHLGTTKSAILALDKTSGTLATDVDKTSETVQKWLTADVITLNYDVTDEGISGHAYRVYNELVIGEDETEYRYSWFLTVRETNLGDVNNLKPYVLKITHDTYTRELDWTLIQI